MRCPSTLGLWSSQRAKERVGELGKNADWKSRSSKKPCRIPRRNLKYRPSRFRRCQQQFSSRVCSHTTIVRHHPRSGNLIVQTGEEKFNHTKARVSRWAHGNQSWGQIEGSLERIPYRERVRLARQQCSPTLDQRGWKLQVVCGDRVRKIQDKNCIRWRHVGTTDNPADFGSRGGHLFETTNLWWPPDIVTSPTRGKMRPQSSGKY